MSKESPIGRKIEFKTHVYLRAEHLMDHSIPRILYVASMTAPKTVDDVIVITDLWRTGSGYHPKFKAVDIRTGIGVPLRRGAIDAQSHEMKMRRANEWAGRMRIRLGFEYDVIFGDEDHIDHIHIEHDSTKELITWKQPNGD